jgi:hypothetical protein
MESVRAAKSFTDELRF